MFTNALPLTFDLIDGDTTPTFTIKIVARRAKISDHGKSLCENNVWRYVREGSYEDKCEKHAHEHCDCILATNIGPIINVSRDQELKIVWDNQLKQMSGTKGMTGMDAMSTGTEPMSAMLEAPPFSPVPDGLMTGMNPSVGVVTHLHGAKVAPPSDGWPLDPLSYPGNTFKRNADSNRAPSVSFPTSEEYVYTNDQRACMLWFHDHGMDNTGPQVFAGLAGLYFIRDDSDKEIFDLIDDQNAGKKVNTEREIPLVLQDRMVDCDAWHVNYLAGSPYTTTLKADGTIDSQDFDRPEFLGDTIFVNGRPWPHHELDLNVYRLRVLNGSNARTYALALIDPSAWANEHADNQPTIWFSDLITVIGNDGGLFPKSQPLKKTDYILLAPGERLDLLLDLTSLNPDKTKQLRLVNLAVSNSTGVGSEPIFQTENAINIGTGLIGVTSSVLQIPATSQPEFDKSLLAAISQIRAANILQFCINLKKPGKALDTPALDAILKKYANDDDFAFVFDDKNNVSLAKHADPVKNRLVLQMNDTLGVKGSFNPVTGDIWHDTQIWEMVTAQANDKTFAIPFNIDLDKNQPDAGDVTNAGIAYTVARSSWFSLDNAFSPISAGGSYAPLHPAVIKPKAGTYARWYVANVGNPQPLIAAVPVANQSATVPDMHPFHIHLVNFIVLRRFVLDSLSNVFKPVAHANTFDGLVRHDTVRIQSNELLELCKRPTRPPTKN